MRAVTAERNRTTTAQGPRQSGRVVLLVVRVITWNLWWRHGDFEERQRAIEDVLLSEQADVCCLQEVWANENGDHQGRLIAETLGYDLATTDGPFFNGWSVNNVVLSRFPIVTSSTTEIGRAHV